MEFSTTDLKELCRLNTPVDGRWCLCQHNNVPCYRMSGDGEFCICCGHPEQCHTFSPTFPKPQPESEAVSDWWEERKKREKDRLNELARRITDDEIKETSYEDSIICPYCGYDDSDDRYDGEGSHTYWCGRCDEEYECEVHVTIRYSTVRVNPKRKE